MTKHVIVPIEDLQKIEQARVALYELIDPLLDDYLFQSKVQNITKDLWRVANTKYPTGNIASSDSVLMKKHTSIPDVDGLYYYCVPNEDPEPVWIQQARYGEGKFKGFNGRTQSWLREDEYLIGPQTLPNPENYNDA